MCTDTRTYTRALSHARAHIHIDTSHVTHTWVHVIRLIVFLLILLLLLLLLLVYLHTKVHGKIDSTQHGVGGPLTTCFREPVNPISEAFVAACNDAGHQTIDYNSGAELGASLFQQTVRDGQRCHTAMAFLKPARERANNLTINTHCHVAKVVVEAKDDGRKVATGVQCYVGKGAGPGSPQTLFRASKEVIVSGGAIGSPQILQLSGIGDQELLKAVGIPLVHHLPGVGANLQDHLMLPMLFRPGYEYNNAQAFICFERSPQRTQSYITSSFLPIIDFIHSVVLYLLLPDFPFFLKKNAFDRVKLRRLRRADVTRKECPQDLSDCRSACRADCVEEEVGRQAKVQEDWLNECERSRVVGLRLVVRINMCVCV